MWRDQGRPLHLESHFSLFFPLRRVGRRHVLGKEDGDAMVGYLNRLKRLKELSCSHYSADREHAVS